MCSYHKLDVYEQEDWDQGHDWYHYEHEWHWALPDDYCDAKSVCVIITERTRCTRIENTRTTGSYGTKNATTRNAIGTHEWPKERPYQ